MQLTLTRRPWFTGQAERNGARLCGPHRTRICSRDEIAVRGRTVSSAAACEWCARSELGRDPPDKEAEPKDDERFHDDAHDGVHSEEFFGEPLSSRHGGGRLGDRSAVRGTCEAA